MKGNQMAVTLTKCKAVDPNGVINIPQGNQVGFASPQAQALRASLTPLAGAANAFTAAQAIQVPGLWKLLSSGNWRTPGGGSVPFILWVPSTDIASYSPAIVSMGTTKVFD